MTRVLLAGESWISHSTHYKGFDEFSSTTIHTGADAFMDAARSQDIEIERCTPTTSHSVSPHGRGPVVVRRRDPFRHRRQQLSCFPLGHARGPTFGQSACQPCRIDQVRWRTDDGGGYLSFQGFHARANFARSPIAEVLPVTMLDCDDRVEAPQGAAVVLSNPDHPVGRALQSGAPQLLGYNLVQPRDEAEVVARVGGDVLIATMETERGRALVWTSDIGPHWCPAPFLAWGGFAALVGAMLTWLGAGQDQ